MKRLRHGNVSSFMPSGVLSARNGLHVPKPQAEAWGY